MIESFRNSKGNYGARRIKAELNKKSIVVSRRRIRQIMKENFLISTYQNAYFKLYNKSKSCNHEKIENIVDRNFSNREYREVLVSDLTYIDVGSKTAYICFITDLFNREIIGYSVGFSKTSGLVLEAFMSIKDLEKVCYFHTDRGNEFKNEIIDELLCDYGIKRSLSNPGVPYDNACAESLYKTTKTEFVRNRVFESLKQVRLELDEYVGWYNNERLHSSLNYSSPVKYRLNF